MPSRNTFKHALAAKIPQIGLWSTLPGPYVSELLAGADPDRVTDDVIESEMAAFKGFMKQAGGAK